MESHNPRQCTPQAAVVGAPPLEGLESSAALDQSPGNGLFAVSRTPRPKAQHFGHIPPGNGLLAPFIAPLRRKSRSWQQTSQETGATGAFLEGRQELR